MQSSVIGKIDKARRYAQERERVNITTLAATFQGDHRDHQLGYEDGKWSCSCSFFPDHGMCSHTLALQRILEPMLAD